MACPLRAGRRERRIVGGLRHAGLHHAERDGCDDGYGAAKNRPTCHNAPNTCHATEKCPPEYHLISGWPRAVHSASVQARGMTSSSVALSIKIRLLRAAAA